MKRNYEWVVINHKKEVVDVWGHAPNEENGEGDWQRGVGYEVGFVRGSEKSAYERACETAKDIAKQWGYKTLF